MKTRLVVRTVKRFALAAAALMALQAVPATHLLGQGGPPERSASGRGSRGMREIDQRVQRRIAAMLKERLALTEEQVRQLEEVTLKLEGERRRVRGEEFRVRVALRKQLMAGDSASNDSIAVLLDRMPGVERRKIDLQEAEQRELAKFLTPLQRARYISLQEEIRRSMEQIRERRTPDGGGRTRPDGAPTATRP